MKSSTVSNPAAKQRLVALEVLLKDHFPMSHLLTLKITANLRYVMSASSERYYRMHFDFNSQMATECGQLLVIQSLAYLDSKTKNKS